MTYKLTCENYVIKDGTTKVPTADVPGFDLHTESVAYREWLSAGGVPEPADPPSPDEMIAAVQVAVQQRLDTFARTRAYDGILSAATYAASAVPKFAAEGQYAVQARDATWAACYQIMADVQAGLRPMPTIEHVLSELPTLEWPL